MTTQVQKQQADESQRGGQKRKRLSQWQLLIIIVVTVIIVALAFTAGQILANLGMIPRLWATILSTFVTVFGTAFAFLGLLSLFFREKSEPTAASSPTFPTPQIIVQVPTTQPLSLPTPDKTAYRGILGMPPPTDPRTIQQREKVVNEVYTKLTQPDITAIVLTGIGGVGKSTLAALVYRYSEEQRHAGTGLFQDEPIWLTVNDSVTMADLAGSLFDALGKPLPDFSSLSSHSQALALFNALNTIEKARLIVLDQFENLLEWETGHALTDRPGVGEWIDTINSQKCICRVLLTSRPWPQGTREYPPTHMQEYYIKGLEVTEGIELLKKRGIEATEAELCIAVERCEGHAYALTFLASLLRSHNLSLGVLFKDATYAQLWKGDIAHNLLDYIYTKQLSEIERKLLLTFSVYRESVPLDAARAAIDFSTEMPKAQVLFALRALRTQHLLQASGDGHYQLHAIVADYAQDHFDEKNEQANQEARRAAHARAAQYYKQRAATTCPAREQRRRSSDVQPLIEAVWQHCQAEQWQEAYNLMEQKGIFDDLKRWGGNAILLELCQLLLPVDKWHPEHLQEADIYNNLGEVYRVLGRGEQAREYHEQALRIYQEVGDCEGEGWALIDLGRVYYDLGNKERARECYEQALKICQETNNCRGEGTMLTYLGQAYESLRQQGRAQEYYEQALSFYRKIGDRGGEGWTLYLLGRIYNERIPNHPLQKEYALKYCKEAVSILREVGDRGREGWALHNLGRIYSVLGQNKQAQLCYDRGLSIHREVGDRRGEAWAFNNLGKSCVDLGEYEQAREHYSQALSIYREIGARWDEGSTLNNIGWAYADLGETERAREYYEQALSIRDEVGDRWGKGRTLKNLGRVYTTLGEKERAMECLEQGLKISKEVGDRDGEARALHYIGMLYLKQHYYGIALASFLLAKRILDEIQSPYRDRIQESIEKLQEEVGAEEYSVLLAEVEPQAAQIVERALREGLG